MSKVFVAVLVCAFATTFVLSASLPSGNSQNVLDRFQNSSGWELIGRVGEKFFLKNNATVNWMAARGICQSEDLEFATFQNSEEYRFVFQNATAPSGLWVSAIMRGAEQFRPHAFNWDANGESIADEISYHMFSYHWICLYFSSDDHLYSDFCLDGQHQVLCQLRL